MRAKRRRGVLFAAIVAHAHRVGRPAAVIGKRDLAVRFLARVAFPLGHRRRRVVAQMLVQPCNRLELLCARFNAAHIVGHGRVLGQVADER